MSARRSGSRIRFAPLTVAAAATAMVVVALGGCSADTPQTTPSPTASTPPIEVVASGDGVLSIGTLFPLTGALSAVGASQVAAVDAAVRAVNEAGGFRGAPVVVTHRDSADAASDRILTSADDLVSRGVDVVVGPMTSDDIARVSTVFDSAEIPLVSLSASTPDGPTSTPGELQQIFVPDGAQDVASDAMREPATPVDQLVSLVRSSDPGVTDFRFAAEAFDAVSLVTLAAVAAGDDGGASIASVVRSVTTGEYPCSSVGQCSAALDDGMSVAFTGASGTIAFP